MPAPPRLKRFNTVRKVPDLMEFRGFLGKRLPRREERKRMVEYLAARRKEKR